MANHLNWKKIEKEVSGWDKAEYIEPERLEKLIDMASMLCWNDADNFVNDALYCPHCGNEHLFVFGRSEGYTEDEAAWDFKRNVNDNSIWYMDVHSLRFNSVASFDPDDEVWVECGNCRARGGIGGSYDDAIELWNKRYRKLSRVTKAEELCMSKNPPEWKRCIGGDVEDGVLENKRIARNILSKFFETMED